MQRQSCHTDRRICRPVTVVFNKLLAAMFRKGLWIGSCRAWDPHP